MASQKFYDNKFNLELQLIYQSILLSLPLPQEKNTFQFHFASQLPNDHPKLSPCKPKYKPGPRRNPIPAVPRGVPIPLATPSRSKHTQTVKFKLGVLSWAQHTRLPDGIGGWRAPARAEVQKHFGLRSINQISKWKRVNDTLILIGIEF